MEHLTHKFALGTEGKGTTLFYLKITSVKSLNHVRLFATPWTAARQASLPITNSQSPPKPMSIESVMPSNHLSYSVNFHHLV